jgi:curved DNA-binding protein CbpA
MDDLYKKLQIDPRAESEVIRAAYYALARKYHPDVGGDLRRMVDFNAAWAVLGNPLLRGAYDAERDRPVAPHLTPERADAHGNNGQDHGDSPPRSKRDSSSILDFGRYAGWSLEQLVERDPDYLEWLVRTSIGRRLSAEVKALLVVQAASGSAVGVGHRGPRSGGPIGERRERTSARRQWFGRSRQGR